MAVVAVARRAVVLDHPSRTSTLQVGMVRWRYRGAVRRDPALIRAKSRLDALALYERPVKIDRVAIVCAGWLFRLPWFRRFDGYTMWNLILLRSQQLRDDDDLICHELCHVWQMQHHPVRMPLSYLRFGYVHNPYEEEARRAAGPPATG